MSKQQITIFCLSVFGAYLLLNANYQARLANNQSDDVESRLSDIETSNEGENIDQKITALGYRIDSVEGEVESIKSDVSLIELRAIREPTRRSSPFLENPYEYREY